MTLRSLICRLMREQRESEHRNGMKCRPTSPDHNPSVTAYNNGYRNGYREAMAWAISAAKKAQESSK
jgi:hypothetical protein